MLSAGAVLGSAVGTRLLDHIPEKGFNVTIRLVLSALALEQLYEGLRGLVA